MSLLIKKFVIGIRPSAKTFRIQSVWGEIVDSVLAAKEKRQHLREDFFGRVGTNVTGDAFTLGTHESGTELTINRDNVVYTKNVYDSDAVLDPSRALEEFKWIWEALNESLRVRNIRRIGIIGEARLHDVPHASTRLLESLATVPDANYPARFNLRYESRSPTPEGNAPDVKKSDFTNIIYSFYDSSMDASAPEDDGINANLDYQRYYAPLLRSDVLGELKKHFKAFEKNWVAFETRLRDLGLLS